MKYLRSGWEIPGIPTRIPFVKASVGAFILVVIVWVWGAVLDSVAPSSMGPDARSGLVYASEPGLKPGGGGVTGSLTAPRVVLVVMDGISLEEMLSADAQGLARMIDLGGFGVMNTRTAKAFTPANAYVTIGAGTRASGSLDAGAGFNAGEVTGDERALAADVYFTRTGLKAAPGSIVHLDIAGLIAKNVDQYSEIRPGAMGSALHKAGIRIAALGNADTHKEPRRFIVALAMDRTGSVDVGYVSGELVTRDPTFPSGYRTDIKKLIQAYDKVKTEVRFIAVELGDTSRVEWYSDYLTKEMQARHKIRAIRDGDEFIRHLIPEIERGESFLLVVSPTPPKEAVLVKNTLAPIIMVGKGIRPGLLTSASTRRRGIVTNLDIAPTVLGLLGVPLPYPMVGAPFSTLPSADSRGELLSLNKRLAAASLQRNPILSIFVGFQIVVSLVAVGAVLAGWMSGPALSLIQAWLLGIITVPLTLLVLPYFNPQTIISSGLFIVLITVALAWLAARLGKGGTGPFIIVNLATAGGLLVDLFLGSPLMKASLLGYDPGGGARFYGMGNEYMGVLIGATIVGVAALRDRLLRSEAGTGIRSFVRAFTPLVFAIGTFALAAPGFGANAGGTLAAIAGFGTTYMRSLGKKVTAGRLVIATLGALALLIAIALIDSALRGGTESHWGRTIDMVRLGGAREIANIVLRKVSMNLRLLRYTVWTRVLLTFIGISGVLLYRPVGLLKTILQKNPNLSSGFAGCVAGAIAAFIFNDSGVVATATITLYPVAILVYIAIEEGK